MSKGVLSKLKRARTEARALWEERAFEGDFHKTTFYKFLHFLVLVIRSFIRNRCHTRASALAYTTLLALIPLLAVGIGVSTALLKKEGVEENKAIQELINRFVDHVGRLDLLPQTDTPATTATNAQAANEETEADTRRRLSDRINELITNARSGTLNVTGALGLILVAVGLLSTIEATFNDIWGISRGRSWFTRLIYYWSAITFVPLLIILGMGLTISANFQAAHDFIASQKLLGALVFTFTPYLILILLFMLIYMFMPNTRVNWRAALIGAVIAAVLWQVNSRFNVFLASRVVSISRIYGSLSVLPVFLIGLYFSWLIVLLGSQIAYAVQNLEAYVQQIQSESVNQRGREFVAFRFMALIGNRFYLTKPPLSGQEIATELGVPIRLVNQIVRVLQNAELVVETANGTETRYSPARPLDKITAQDILSALRSADGQELPTRNDASRPVLRAEFDKIVAAEKRETSQLTLLALVEKMELAEPQQQKSV